MAAQAIPPTLGKYVTTRTYNWRQMVVSAWGEEWGKNDIGYEFANGEKKDNTDRYQTGIYKPY